MKQILQNMKTGVLRVADVPPPSVQRGQILVRTAASLISAGTEKSKIDLGKKSLIGKARERPDLVKKVIDKVKTDGIANTLTAVKAKLDTEEALGYSAAGTVVEVGEGVDEIAVGDRVACAGAGYASHAEMISVPKNLCVRIPEKVTFEQASFGTLGAIALQGLRLAAPTLGEAVVVIGLGLLGQITVQLLRTNGCRVFGVDTDCEKFDLARELGAEMCCVPAEAARLIERWSRGRGADAVLITAATKSNDPVELAGEISRLKGRVIVVGLVGMNIPREIYYNRELTLQLSMSYGPGRYDAEYEERGHDYPYEYVRWTEGRNIEAFLDLVASGGVDLDRLITHRFPIEQGEAAYRMIEGGATEPYLGIVLQYDTAKALSHTVKTARSALPESTVRIGMIGAGSYARKFLLPNFKANGVEFRSIATASGRSARDIATQYGFEGSVSVADQVIADDAANAVVIATRHNTHARLAIDALTAGKHVFVEKPLAMNDTELDAVAEAARRSATKHLLVGFNRRFSPAALRAKEFFVDRRSPMSILYRINAGRIDGDSWIQDPIEGGGRIIGEVCHFIDLMHFLTGSLTRRVFAEAISSRDAGIKGADSVFVTLRFADGSNGSIAYIAEGDRSLPKERIEIFGEGRACVIDDFRRVTLFTGGRQTTHSTRGQDKGQAAEVKGFCDLVKNGGPTPIDLDDLIATTRATFRIMEALRTGQPAEV